MGSGFPKRTWFDSLFYCPSCGLMPCRGRFWLIGQAGQDQHVWLREAQFYVLVMVHSILLVMG